MSEAPLDALPPLLLLFLLLLLVLLLFGLDIGAVPSSGGGRGGRRWRRRRNRKAVEDLADLLDVLAPARIFFSKFVGICKIIIFILP